MDRDNHLRLRVRSAEKKILFLFSREAIDQFTAEIALRKIEARFYKEYYRNINLDVFGIYSCCYYSSDSVGGGISTGGSCVGKLEEG